MKKFLTKKYIISAIILVLIIVGFISYKSRKNANDNQATIVPSKDEVVTPEIKNIQDELTLSGYIDALNKADIHFQASGLLTWVGVKEGDTVKKWQSLASLDRRQLQKSLEAQFNNYQTQLSQFNDTQDKYQEEKDNLVLTDEMKRILNRSQFALDNSVIQYELADLAIKYATIYTPISGIVTTVEPSQAGVNVTPASSNFVVVDPSSIYFHSEAEQDDVVKIKNGQKAIIQLDSYPDTNIEGTISYISFAPISGRSTPTYNVRVNFPLDQVTNLYRLGMDGDATIWLSQSTNALVIPVDALIEEDDKKFVYLKNINSNSATKVEVTTGIETDLEVEILSGISKDDQVVIKAK